MTDPYTITGPLKVEEDGGTAGLILDVDSASTNSVTIRTNQQVDDMTITLDDPITGQTILASSGTTGGWKYPVDVRDGGVSISAAQFRSINFTGNATITDGGGGVADVSLNGVTTKQLSIYDSVGGQTFTTTDTTINYDQTRRNSNSGADFTVSTGEVTVNTDDHYMIMYTISIENTNGNANSRSISTGWLEVDTGSGFAEIPGTRGYAYHRNSAGSGGNVVGAVIYEAFVGDVIRVRAVRQDGSGTLSTISNASGLHFANTGGIGGSGGASGSSILVQDSGVALGGGYTTLNFIDDVSAVDAGSGVAEIQVNFPTPTIAIKDESSSLGDFEVLNFVGAAVTATDGGGGQANITVIASGSGVEVEEEGVSVGTGFTVLNIVGAGATATDAGSGTAQITVPGSLAIEDENVSVGNFTTLNFLGATVAATDAGSGQADVTITPSVEVQDEGSGLGGFQTFNFVGAGVTAADGGSDVTTITIPGGGSGVAIEDENVSVGNFTILNFTGSGVTATDAGSGQADITVAGGGSGGTVDVADEGSVLGGFSQINFIGAAITAVDGGAGKADVTVTVPPPTIQVEDDDVDRGDFNILNFTDTGVAVVTVVDSGSGQATIDVNVPIPTIVVEDEGSGLGSFDTINFIGPGVTTTDGGGAHANVTIDTSITVEDSNVSLGGFTILNFTGDISAVNGGGGQVDITADTTLDVLEGGVSQGSFSVLDFQAPITVGTSGSTAVIDPRIPIQDAGVAIGRFSTINFTGTIPVVTDAGAGVANVFIDQSGLAGTIGVATYYDQKTTGSNGGASVAATWTTRTLQTGHAENNLVGASLSSNQITLGAGTYWVYAQAPAYRCEHNRIRLYNVTGAVSAILGVNAFAKNSGNSGQVGALLQGVINIVGSTVFEIQHYAGESRGDGFGLANGFTGISERYTSISLIKLSVDVA
jgi:hypothetical protein